MGTSIISQWFFSKTACSLYGTEEEKFLKEKLTAVKGDHVHLCVEGSWQVKVESFIFSGSLSVWDASCPLLLL